MVAPVTAASRGGPGAGPLPGGRVDGQTGWRAGALVKERLTGQGPAEGQRTSTLDPAKADRGGYSRAMTLGTGVPRSIFVELMFERPADRAELDAHIVRWLEEGLAALGADLREGIAARPPLQRPSGGRPFGEPFTPWGTLFVSRLREGKQRTTDGVFSEAGWQRFLARVVAPDVHLAVVTLCMLDDRGRALGPTIQVIYETVGTDWIRLGAMFETSSLMDPDFVRRLRMFVWSTARLCNPAFGLIDHRYRRTQMEEDLASVDEENIPFMRETLRAHGWLTVVPQEIAEKLGGSSGLAATGAFGGLEELTNGGIMAWATGDFTEYDQPRIARIEKVFAPYLLTKEVVLRHRNILAGRHTASKSDLIAGRSPAFTLVYDAEIVSEPRPQQRWLLYYGEEQQAPLTFDLDVARQRVLLVAAARVRVNTGQEPTGWVPRAREDGTPEYRAVHHDPSRGDITLVYGGQVVSQPRSRHGWLLYCDGESSGRFETSTGPDGVLTAAAVRISLNYNRQVVRWEPRERKDGLAEYRAVLGA